MKKPLSALLVKPAGADCNMACRYCFYSEKGGLYPETKTHRMTDAVLEEMIRQMMAYGASEVSFCWQGGEPTLMGIDFFRRAVAHQIRYGRGKTVGNAVQSNGVLIDAAWADFLFEYRFLIGISLDGPQHVHDRYRGMAGGGSSWSKTLRAAKRLLDRGVSVNAMSVINDYSSRYPDAVYGFLKETGLRHMQFIPCVEPDMEASGGAATYCVSADDYGRFLCRVFDLWRADFQDGQPTTSIRFFESLVFSYAGMPPPDCSLMAECGDYLVVEHTGDVYCCDFFVTPEHRLGNVARGRLDGMLNAGTQTAFGKRKKALPIGCAACEYLAHCRGGCPKDRLKDAEGRGVNHLCGAYKMFFAHAEGEIKRLVNERRRQLAASEIANQNYARRPDRNQSCPCGSGLKFKKCCGKA